MSMAILELGYQYVPSALTIHHTHTVGLGILEDEGSGWVGDHSARGFFHSLDDFKKWMLRVLANYLRILKSAGIFDTIWAFQDRLTLGNREVM